MAKTFQEWVTENRNRGVTAQDLKDGFFQRYGVKLDDQDANADYDAFKADFEAKQFVGPVQPQTPEKPLQVVAPTPTPEKPTQAVVERDTGSLRALPGERGDPLVEPEGFIKAGARYLLPKAFGIEEAILGPDPDTLPQYDKRKAEAEIAKFRTIKEGEYEFDPRQVARLPGMVAGAAVEAAKLPLELAAQIPEAALRAAQLVTPFADLPESQARQLSAEEYRKDIAKGLTKAGEAVTEGAMKVAQQVTPFADVPAKQLAPQITPEDITPKATQEVVKRYLGEDPEEELRLQSKDIYTLMQEDVEEVLAGVTQATFTDIIPLLPSKNRKDFEGYFKEGFERGEQLPGFLAAGGAIIAKSAGLIAEGEIGKGIRALYERPATFLLTLAPIVGKLPAPMRAKLLKVYTAPAYAPFFTAKLGTKGLARVVDALRKQEPGTAETYLKQKFVDPLEQRTPEETARAERIYEEARATREKTRTATERLAEEVETAEPRVVSPEEAVITESGVQVLEKIDPEFYKTGDTSLLSERQKEYFAERDRRILQKRKPNTDITNLSPKNLTLAEMQEAGIFTGELRGDFSLAYEALFQDATETGRVAVDAPAEADIRTRYEDWVDRSQARIAKEQGKFKEYTDAADQNRIDKAAAQQELSDAVLQGAKQRVLERLDKKVARLSQAEAKNNTKAGEAYRKSQELIQEYNTEKPKRLERLKKKEESLRAQAVKASERLFGFEERLGPEAGEAALTERAGVREGLTAVERQQIVEGRRFARQGERPAVLEEGAVSYERPGLRRYSLGAEDLGAMRAAADVLKEFLKDIPEDIRDFAIQEEAKRPGSSVAEAYRQLSTNDVRRMIRDVIIKDPTVDVEGFAQSFLKEQEPAEIVTRPVDPSVITDVKESFRPSFPEGMSGKNFQFTPEIQRIVAEGVADIVEKDINVLLADPAVQRGFSNYLARKYFNRVKQTFRERFTKEGKKIRKSREESFRTTRGHIQSLLQERASKRTRGDFGLKSTRLTQEITAAELKESLAEYLSIPEKGGADILKQEIKDRVLFDVRNRAFREGLAQNIKQETAGIDPVTGEPIADPVGVALDIVDRQKRSGHVSFAVSVPEGNFSAVLSQVAEQTSGTSSNLVKTLEKYVPASPELAKVIGRNTYVSPSFNSAFTSIIKSFDTIGKVELGFNRIVAELKRGFTSRNLSSAKNNYLSNVLLYTLYYGAVEGAKLVLSGPQELVRVVTRDVTGRKEPTIAGYLADPVLQPLTPESNRVFTRFVRKKPTNRREAILFDSYRESGLVDNTNISNEVSLLKKGNLVTEYIIDPAARKGVPGAAAASRAIKKINVGQDAAYTFGDNYFKILAASTEANVVFDILDNVLEPSPRGQKPVTVTLRLGERLTVEIAKDAEGNFYRVEPAPAGGEGKVIRRPLRQDELTRLVGKSASKTALDKFVDYERIPGYLAWLRSTAPGGIVSLFSTWAYKMMDAPGKRGILSHMLANEGAIINSSSPKVNSYLNQVKTNRGMARAAATAVARTQINQEQDGDVRRMLAYNPTGLQLITYSTSEVDPSTLIYRDSTATNFLGPSEAMTRLLIGSGAFVADLFLKATSDQVGPVVDSNAARQVMGKDDFEIMKDMRKLFYRYKSGQLISAKDALTVAQFAGNPVFDFFDMFIASDSNPYIDVTAHAMKTVQSIAVGGTAKYMMDAAVANSLGAEYLRQGKGGFLPLLFSKVYKKTLNYSYRSEQIESQRTMARDIINMTLGTSYRYSFIHKRIGNKDKGAFSKWVDAHKKNLDASLLRAEKLRLQSLATAGYKEDDPAMREVVRRFTLLKEAVDLEHAAFKMRVFKAIDKTGFYENLEKTK